VVFEAGGRALQLTLATTDRKREKLMGEILLGMVTPQVLLFVVTIALVWAGIRRGLEPVADLQAEIAVRSHSDLRPLDPEAAPDELRPMVREINQLFARLDGAIESQRHFIADAAHQLRTPVAGLLAQVESAGGGADPALAATARRLSRLVGQLLALSRAEPGVEAPMADLDLATLIREAADDWLPRAFRRDMDLQFELAECRLRGSAHALRELLANLVDNAIRYGRDGGRIVVRCQPADGEVVLQVEDDGPGIPAAGRDKVFERFHRLPGAGADGCGLGLPIVQGLARQHGGKVSLDDSPALGGLRVTVTLPR
jgi:two-component system sensor histidine kinase TctE